MKVLVCGGRGWRDGEFVERVLDRVLANRGPIERLIHGDAHGADQLAGAWARKHGVLEWDFLPEWHRVEAPDAAARNQRMIEASPDLVIAFPGGAGTADMLKRVRDAGIEVVEVDAKLAESIRSEMRLRPVPPVAKAPA